jgi:hypothetical protein
MGVSLLYFSVINGSVSSQNPHWRNDPWFVELLATSVFISAADVMAVELFSRAHK